MTEMIYKILTQDQWDTLQDQKETTGAPIDVADGYVHFSTATQVQETADKHFKGQTDLYLLALNSAKLGDALKWEVSRGDELFPHLYGLLRLADVDWSKAIPFENDRHQIPAL